MDFKKCKIGLPAKGNNADLISITMTPKAIEPKKETKHQPKKFLRLPSAHAHQPRCSVSKVPSITDTSRVNSCKASDSFDDVPEMRSEDMTPHAALLKPSTCQLQNYSNFRTVTQTFEDCVKREASSLTDLEMIY